MHAAPALPALPALPAPSDDAPSDAPVNQTVWLPCTLGCGTTLAVLARDDAPDPPTCCARCTAGKPAWEVDPPYILAPGDLVPVEVEAAREYLRDGDGIPLPGQVVPLNLAAYLAQDRPLDTYTVVSVLIEFAVRADAGRVAPPLLAAFSPGRLAFQLLHAGAHRGDHRLAPIAAEWLKSTMLANTHLLPGNLRHRVSTLHRLAGAGEVGKLASFCAACTSAGVPLDDVLFTLSSRGRSLLSHALEEQPANLPEVALFLVSAMLSLSPERPTLPALLTRTFVEACGMGHVPTAMVLLEDPRVHADVDNGEAYNSAVRNQHWGLVYLLDADERFAPWFQAPPLPPPAPQPPPPPVFPLHGQQLCGINGCTKRKSNCAEHNVFNQCGVGGCTVHKSRCTKHKVMG